MGVHGLIRPFFKYTKRNPFLPSFYVHNFELIPMLVIYIGVLAGVSIFSLRTGLNCMDLMWTRNSPRPEELTDLLIHPRSKKLLHFNQVYEPNQELYDLYEDMRKAKEEKCQ